ncbi:MAG: Asp-tRNA(Asn)/Glu-tRNA(Gln) amidotransferase subunit GatC [Saprospiraceae bacterium]|nr:Asp-tRNA(Asn)/Glu-tRNA(Gln) amidotransferase subunit GatC [Saprospiraceae bacterium]
MQADNSLISRLEKLARLQLSPEEKPGFASDLNQILQMVDRLLELDTAGVEPLAYPTLPQSGFRADEPGTSNTAAQALQNAPDHDGQFFIVPKVID